MLRLLIHAVLVVMLCGGVCFADEFYQDENGVWRNRKAPSHGRAPSASEELYQDEKGVWRNRSVKEKDNSAGAAVQSVGEDLLKGLGDVISAPAIGALEDAAATRESAAQSNKYNRIKVNKGPIVPSKASAPVKEERNFSGYERFDPAKDGKVKSEWEQFEDPR